MSELMGKIKTDWKEIPTWAKIGAIGGGALLFVLAKKNGSSTGLPTLAGTPASVGTTITSLQPSSNTGTTGSTSSTTSGTPSSDNGGSTFQATLPSAALNPVLLPLPSSFTAHTPNSSNTPTLITPILTPAQETLQNGAIQAALGPYGGPIVSQSTPYAGLGANWDTVTVSQTAGGGTVTNLGVAQPAPNPGQVIPSSVQDQTVYIPGTSIPDWAATIQQAYQYPSNFSPGMLQPQAVATPKVPVYQSTVPTPVQSPGQSFYDQQAAAAQAAIADQTQATRNAQLATFAATGHY